MIVRDYLPSDLQSTLKSIEFSPITISARTLNKYREMTQPCRTLFLTRNHSDSVPTTLTLVSCFLYSLASKSNQVQRISHVHHSHPELIIWDRVECLLEVHKAHIEWLLVLVCLVHQYSEIRDLVSCPPALSEFRLFVCNFCFGLHLDPFQYGLKKDRTCMWDKSKYYVICTLFKTTSLGNINICEMLASKWIRHRNTNKSLKKQAK